MFTGTLKGKAGMHVAGCTCKDIWQHCDVLDTVISKMNETVISEIFNIGRFCKTQDNVNASDF